MPGLEEITIGIQNKMASVFAKLNFVEKFNKLGEKKATEEVKEVLSCTFYPKYYCKKS